MHRTIIGFSAVVLLLTLSAVGQEYPRVQIGLQGNGFFTKSSTQENVRQTSSESGGFLVDFRYGLSRWVSADVAWGRNRITNRYSTPGSSSIQTTVNQFIGGFAFHLPDTSKLSPYLLAEGGALLFTPTDSGAPAGATRQASGAFAYGAGVDIAIVRHIGLRAEYRGLVYNTPEFNINGLTGSSVTHTAEPSAGVVFSF